MAQPKKTVVRIVNAEIEATMAKAAGAAKTKTVDIFGEEFEITTDVNYWLLTRLSGGDISVISELFESILVRKADKPGLSASAKLDADLEDAANIRRLNRTLGRQRGLDENALVGLFGRLTEVAAERPTKSSSASSRTGTQTDD